YFKKVAEYGLSPKTDCNHTSIAKRIRIIQVGSNVLQYCHAHNPKNLTLELKTGIIIHKKPAATYDTMIGVLTSGDAEFSVTLLYFTTERNIGLDSTAVVSKGIWYVVQGFRMVHGRYIKISSAGRLTYAFIDVIQMVLANCCTRVVLTNAQRIALTAVLLFVVVVSHAYSGQLLGLLANPPRTKDPQTLQEAAPKVESVYIIENLKADVLNANEDGSLTELISKMKPRNFGFDVNVLQRIATQGKENKTGIIIHKKKARTYDVLSTALVKGETDFSATFLYYTIERMITLDATAAVVVGEYCLVMKRAPFLPFGMVLLSPYETSTWATLLLSLGVLTLFWCEVQDYRLVRDRYIKTSSDDRIVHAILDVVQIMLTNSSSRVVQTNAQRVMLSAGLLVVLVLSNAYSGQLLGLLANPPRMKDPQTLQEAARIVDTVYIARNLKAALRSANENGSLTELIQKTKPRKSSLHSVLQRMVKEGKESVITSSRHFFYFAYYKELMDKGGRTLHSVPDCFFTPGHHSFLIRKNSTFFEVLNKVALMSTEGGLFDQWTRSQRHRMDANGVTVPESFSLDELHALTLEQLSGSFTVLSIGWGIATWWNVVNVKYPLKSRNRRDEFCDPIHSVDDKKIQFLIEFSECLKSLLQLPTPGKFTNETSTALLPIPVAILEISKFLLTECSNWFPAVSFLVPKSKLFEAVSNKKASFQERDLLYSCREPEG
ncbi:Uncharacterized protein GBIM_00204, partial [Gryllus bimaculatus]